MRGLWRAAKLDPAWLEELSEVLRIPSVSADPDHHDDVVRAAEWVRDFVRAAGGECELVQGTSPRPLVIGELRASRNADSAPTVLVYGHFDVQPPAPLDQWESPPFEPEIRGEWLFARGVADDKGQLYLLLKAAALLAAEGALPVNVRIACDGEEEVGGHAIVDWLAEDERGADAAVVFDAHQPRRGQPAFYVATRGICYFHVKVRDRRARPAFGHVRRRRAERAARADAGVLRGAARATDGCPSRFARASSRRPTRSSPAGRS